MSRFVLSRFEDALCTWRQDAPPCVLHFRGDHFRRRVGLPKWQHAVPPRAGVPSDATVSSQPPSEG